MQGAASAGSSDRKEQRAQGAAIARSMVTFFLPRRSADCMVLQLFVRRVVRGGDDK